MGIPISEKKVYNAVMTQLPSDQLKRKPRPIRAALIGLGAAAVIVGGTFGGIATANALTPAPKLAPALQIAGPMECDGTVVGQGTCITAADQTAANGQEQAVEDANAAKAAAAAAAAQAAQAAADAAAQQAAQEAARQKANQPKAPAPSIGAGLPAGAVVPPIDGTTSPDTTKCASGSASDDASGVARCD